MAVQRVVFALCYLVSVQAGVRSDAKADTGLDDLERKCLTYRLDKTKRGVVRFRVTHEIDPRPSELIYKTTYDENRIAEVRRMRLLGKQEWGPPSRVILTPKEYIDDLDRDVTAVRSPRTVDPDKKRFEPKTSHPQPLGLDLNGADSLSKRRLASVMISPSYRENVKRTQEKLGGLDVWCLSYQTKSDAEVRVWFAPSQGYGVVRAEHTTPATKTTILVSAKYKEYPPNGVWFPSRLERTITQDGKVVSKQVIMVEEAKFGQPIPDSAFTIGAVGIEPGRKFIDRTSNPPRLKMWDGKKLADPSEVRPANQAVPVLPPSGRYWAVACGGLALLATFCCWWVVRQKSRDAT